MNSHPWDRTNVLVTGGSGYLGAHLVRQLQKRGAFVRILDLNPPPDDLNKTEFTKGDIRDASLVGAVTAHATHVFNAAAKAGMWARDHQDFYSVNQVGSRNVFEAALGHRVQKVIHISAESVIKSRHAANHLLDESTSPSFNDLIGDYCKGKFLAEQEAIKAAERGLNITIVNPTMPIGPGDKTPTPPTRMMRGYATQELTAYLETSLNVVDPRDAAQGMLLAAQRGKKGHRYLLGGENIALSKLLEKYESLSGIPMPKRQVPYWLALSYSLLSEGLIARLTHRPPKAPITGVRLAKNSLRFSSKKARQELGFTTRPLEDSLRDQLTWFRSQGWIQ